MLEERLKKALTAVEVARQYAEHLASLAQCLDFEAIGRFATLLEEIRNRGRSVFLCGNGGSAATSNHFANDLSWGTRGSKFPNGLRAISLASNMPLFSALSNDTCYEDVFVEQMRSLFQPRDLLVAISASGNSENVLRAIRYANEKDGVTVGLVGFDGGKMKGLCQELVHVITAKGEYCPVEDLHMAICHTVSTYLKRKAHGL